MQIEMRDISKAFGQNRVLLGVNLTVRPGEIHALMGENGAGKSTLMNILTGLHKADNGTIRVDGEERVFTSPREAEDFGIAFVHQELNIWPNLTILENLFLMRPLKNSLGMLDWDRMRELAAAKCDELNISLPLEKE
ncbi:MAG: ATP-binding cassette domain-containing protein, partial [Negativicoccus succinicivorans]|nr:ATP-binding cassette domain-containing protein [Negativicoccus succinicivorans]